MTRRTGMRVLMGLAATLAALVLAVWLGVRTVWFREWARDQVATRVSNTINGTLTIGSISGSLFTGVTLQDVVLSDSDGPIITVQTAQARYDIFDMLSGDIPIDDLEVTRPVVTLVNDDRGWNVRRLVRATSPSGSARGFMVRRVMITDAAVDLHSHGTRRLSVSNVDLLGSLAMGAQGLVVGIDHVTLLDHLSGQTLEAYGTRLTFDDTGVTAQGLQLITPGLRVAGHLAIPEDMAGATIDLQVSLDQWAPAAHAAYLPPALAALPPLTGHVRAKDLAGAIRATWTLAIDDATSTGDLVVDPGADAPAIRGRISVRHLDPAMVSGAAALAGRVSADLDVDGALNTSAPLESRAAFSLRAGSIAIAGYRADQLHADGIIEDGSLRATTTVAAYGARTRVRVTALHFANGDRRVLTASGRIVALDISRLPVNAAPAIATSLTGDYTVRVRGDAWSAAFEADESRVADGLIEAGSLARAEMHGRALDASVSARVRNMSSAMLPAPAVRATTLEGSIIGEVSIPDLEATDLLDTADGHVRALLADSTVMGAAITRADVDASLAAGLLTVNELLVEGPEIALQASGTMALGAGAAASSDLKVEAEVADMANLPADLVGGLRGGARIVAAVAGTADRPTATGTFNLREPGYKDTADALALAGTFEVVLPGRDLEQIAADVNADGTFVTVSGQQLESVKVTARYEARQLDLEAQLAQKGRSIALDGGLVLFPDYREIQLRALDVSGLGEPWRLVSAGEGTTIRYGADDVHIDGLTFARGAERIHIAGTVGLPDAPVQSDLSVTLEQLNVADLVTLATGTSVVRGTASGSAHLTGAISNPDATASISISDGAVADVPFTLARADVDLTAHRAAITGHVDEPNGARLDIEGAVPVGGDDAAPLDLRVKSSTISLGLLASLTSHLTEITGTAALDVRATGTLATPDLAGHVQVANGALTVVPTGVRYEHIDLGVRLDGDAIVIERASLSDTEGHTLTMTGGGEGLTNGNERSVAIDVSADGIRVLNNELGEVALTADARIDGRLASPSIKGRLVVDRGRIEVDELLPLLGARPPAPVVASTSSAPGTPAAAAEVAAAGPAAAAGETPGATAGERVASALEAAGPVSNGVIEIEMVLPDNTVLRGRNIRTATGSLGLGDMNLTVGGTVALRRSADAPLRVVGAIEVVRGFYEFQGRRFDVEEGSEIRFRGGDTVDPALDVQARREVSGITARVAVSGTAARPRITLSSTPPLDEGDVLSLVVFNQPVSQLGESEQIDLLDRAGEMALGALATGLADSLGEALDVDLFEIHAPSATGTGNVTLGTQLNDRLFVGFRQEFGSAGASRLSFEYRLTEFLRLLTSVGQGGERGRTTRDRENAGADLVFRLRY